MKICKALSDINHTNVFLDKSPKAERNKNKSKQMKLNQIFTFLNSKGKHKQKDGLGENICQQCDCNGINFQNIQIMYVIQ